MNRVAELRDQYYESITLLLDKKDILNALPKPEYENFFPPYRGINYSSKKRTR